eukprot:6181810-Pleurochrysis_carterae.AAC.3
MASWAKVAGSTTAILPIRMSTTCIAIKRLVCGRYGEEASLHLLASTAILTIVSPVRRSQFLAAQPERAAGKTSSGLT